jgi:hypothetical protein
LITHDVKVSLSRPKCHTLTDADDTAGYDDTIRDWVTTHVDRFEGSEHV